VTFLLEPSSPLAANLRPTLAGPVGTRGYELVRPCVKVLISVFSRASRVKDNGPWLPPLAMSLVSKARSIPFRMTSNASADSSQALLHWSAKSELREAIDIEQHLIDASRLVERPSATASHRTLPGGTTRLMVGAGSKKTNAQAHFFYLIKPLGAKIITASPINCHGNWNQPGRNERMGVNLFWMPARC
jgi:hypothetical protein